MNFSIRPQLAWFACLCLIPAAFSQAQERRAPPNYNDLREVNITGKFVGIRGQFMQMTDSTDHPYVVALTHPMLRFAITGTALPDYLKPGMMLSFTADVDESGKVTEPLKELKIVAPLETNTPAFSKEDDPSGTKYFVRGKLNRLKEGTLVLSAARQTVEATLAEDVKIALESFDASLCKPEDEVVLRGRLVKDFRSEGNRIDPGQIIAEQVDIKLAEPATGNKRRSTK